MEFQRGWQVRGQVTQDWVESSAFGVGVGRWALGSRILGPTHELWGQGGLEGLWGGATSFAGGRAGRGFTEGTSGWVLKDE